MHSTLLINALHVSDEKAKKTASKIGPDSICKTEDFEQGLQDFE